MTTTTRTSEAQAEREAQAKREHRRKIVRTIIGRGGAYAVLIGFATAMLFPFLFMVAAALKTSEDSSVIHQRSCPVPRLPRRWTVQRLTCSRSKYLVLAQQCVSR